MRFMRASTQKKRNHVIDIALMMFTEQGYENVSVDDIIAATGTSKGTFYHYFKSKEDILAAVAEKQLDIIQDWLNSDKNYMSDQESVDELLTALARSIERYPKLFNSMMALTLQESTVAKAQREQYQLLSLALGTRIRSQKEIQLFISAYIGSIMLWATSEGFDLIKHLRENLDLVWTGLKALEEQKMKIAVIGGGLAGLTAAAYLSQNDRVQGVLFERSPQIGGRAFTYEKEGFTLNFGAHAIYGIDRHTLTTMEKELSLHFESKQVDKRKVFYKKKDEMTEAPLDFVNLVKTDLLTAKEKVRFAAEITAIIANIHQLKNFPTLEDYLEQSNADESVKELWEHLVCSNFFITPEDARKVPGHVISQYYHNLFLSSKPVNYILGSWAVITEQLKQKINTSDRWELAIREGVDSVEYRDRKYVLKTKNREMEFDRVVFAMPVQQVAKLLKDTPWEPFVTDYEDNTATEVMVYDVGFNHVVARPFSYISDMNNKLFISDVSATDHTIAPEGGQLLQGVAYLSDENYIGEDARKEYLEKRTAQMESLFDQYYPGWREEIAVKRISKKAMVQSVKNIVSNKLLPNRIESVPFFFCGDGCEGKGELAERAFSSARNVAQMILEDVTR